MFGEGPALQISPIQLQEIEEQMFVSFAHDVMADDEWQGFVGRSGSPLQWLTDRHAAEMLGMNYTRGVFLPNGLLVGFITADWVEDSWVTDVNADSDASRLGDRSHVLECGTYLLKNYRGLGLNGQIKRATVRWAKQLGAAWVVYLVPVGNTPALHSLRRLLPAYESSSTMKKFASWLKYREWKDGGKLILFAIPTAGDNRTGCKSKDHN